MAAGGGRGPLRSILGMIGAGVAAGCALVVLVTTPAWSTISTLLGVGDPSAGLEDAVALKGGPVQGNPDARTPAQWWALLAGRAADAGGSAGDDGETSVPDADGTGTGEDAAGGEADAVASWDAATALGMLDSIPAAPADPDTPAYDRESAFGGWAARDGGGSTRDLILERDLTDVTVEDGRVTSGLLHDPYTGGDIRFEYGPDTSGSVWVDHIVSLEDAWRSGAAAWTGERRRGYMNDPDVLLAVDGGQAEAKGDGFNADGTIWLPSDPTGACGYAAARVAVKHAYGLSMTDAERESTRSVLASCPVG